ncbi:hypothetical protein DKP76_13875 [Falsochrobactrum shanghaiense]|uniref:Uncharacterized protein n=1 Tax=Falsochrobactrum shanghaiense TaxID=2201899 RepID=A0A316J613_9HYPH|nr:hypothetical protein DKP76_13875 [Falsochrobactrum shanghaiense]
MHCILKRKLNAQTGRWRVRTGGELRYRAFVIAGLKERAAGIETGGMAARFIADGCAAKAASIFLIMY